MAYDNESFLAGIAVGRNMESWPAMEGNTIFRFTIHAAAGQWSTPSMVFSGMIDWGDGSRQTSFNNIPIGYNYDYADRGQANHTYAAEGNYQITLNGKLLDWSTNKNPNNPGINRTLLSIDMPFPRSMKDRKSFSSLVRYSTNLISLPSGLFRYCEGINNLYGAFWDCRALATLPPQLLLGCENVTHIQQLFRRTALIDLPEDLFIYTPNVESLSFVFSHITTMQRFPDGIFAPLTKLREVDGMCWENTGLVGIQRDLFANLPVENFGQAFWYCTGIVEDIPPYWTDFPNADGNGCFEGCRNAPNYSSIPEVWRLFGIRP